MPEINDRERRVLIILALILGVGGVVRLISASRPEWTPGFHADASTAPPEESRIVGSTANPDSLFDEGRLNLNAAGEAHLQLLPGIGPALAKRVVEWRRENGRFTHLDQLDEVRGIGPKTLDRLRPLVSVGG